MSIGLQHVVVFVLVAAALWVAVRSICGLPVLRRRSRQDKSGSCDRCARR